MVSLNSSLITRETIRERLGVTEAQLDAVLLKGNIIPLPVRNSGTHYFSTLSVRLIASILKQQGIVAPRIGCKAF